MAGPRIEPWVFTAAATGNSGQKSKENLAEYIEFDMILRPSVDKVEKFIQTNRPDINDTNPDGETALMLVCHMGNVNIARLLLQKGADPNLICKRKGNTALHMACEHEVIPRNGDDYYDDNKTEKRWLQADKTSLVLTKLLLKNGATMKKNDAGFTPADIAALEKKIKTVTHCVCGQWMDSVDKIRALEIIGMSLGIFGDNKHAFMALHQARKMRMEENIPAAESHKAELESFFGRAETETLNGLEKLKADVEGMRVEGFLVGERVMTSDKLKERHVYEMLAGFGFDSLFSSKKQRTEAFRILSYCIKLEGKGLLRFGRILNFVMDGIGRLGMGGQLRKVNKEVDEFIGHVCDILGTYAQYFREVDLAILEKQLTLIVDDLAKILFDITDDFFCLKFVNAVFEQVSKIILIIRARVPNPSFKARDFMQTSYSVCHRVIFYMAEVFDERRHKKQSVAKDRRFTRLVAQILQVEDAMTINSTGYSMIDSLVVFLSMGRIRLVMDIARVLLRHGCHSNRAREKKRSLRESIEMELSVLEEQPFVKQAPKQLVKDLYDLLCGPRKVVSLQELSVMAIYRHQIPYRKSMPCNLWHIIQDPILLEPESAFR